jgi:hypothetical protein
MLVSYQDTNEVFARARLVRNTVEPDPDAPTLGEVREMIDEAMAEEFVAEEIAEDMVDEPDEEKDL